jgi:hypothetical protein
MRVRTLTWDKVTIKYPKKNKEDFVFKNAIVDCHTIEDGGNYYSITIKEIPQTDTTPNHTYARPKILELTPWGFKAEAYWFSNDKIDDMPVTIIGEFDDER